MSYERLRRVMIYHEAKFRCAKGTIYIVGRADTLTIHAVNIITFGLAEFITFKLITKSGTAQRPFPTIKIIYPQ